MSIVNCQKHGKIIGINACLHIADDVKNGRKIQKINSIKYEFFPDDKENPYMEHFYCIKCSEKYNIPEKVIISSSAMEDKIEPNMYEDAQEELTILCPKCFDENRQ